MVIIGYDYDGYPISIVNAKNEQLAYAYWQGANIKVHSTKSLDDDFASLDEHLTGVYPILETREKALSEFGGDPKKCILVAK